ncbi:MAG TPA: hypothetical protein VD927_10665 [Chryseosolibacter sp.]|nr:hypothetical protein [Chryseosolibacter sp.]
MKFAIIIVLTVIFSSQLAQAQKTDTVVVPLARTSQIIFTISDYKDLETLRHYNFQALFDDVLKRLSASDTTLRADTTPVASSENEEWNEPSQEEAEEDEDWDEKVSSYTSRRTWQTVNVDLGTNNLFSGDQFVDDSKVYAVRPWGSWYVGINSVHRSRLAKKFFIEWNWGVSWYNFKFENDDVVITTSETGVDFSRSDADVDYVKSKLTATYINTSLVPILDFGDRTVKPRVWDGYGTEFRIGIGPYVGYRLASKSKLVFEEDGEREKEKDRDRFYLNNLRYGVRLQWGFRSTDFFVNYDLNEMFQEKKGPHVNAVSFGIIF